MQHIYDHPSVLLCEMSEFTLYIVMRLKLQQSTNEKILDACHLDEIVPGLCTHKYGENLLLQQMMRLSKNLKVLALAW